MSETVTELPSWTADNNDEERHSQTHTTLAQPSWILLKRTHEARDKV